MNFSFHRVLLSLALLMALPGVSACQIQFSKGKGLVGAEGMAVRKGNGEIVIFYANETPQSQVMTTQYARIANALATAEQNVSRQSEKIGLNRIAMSYQNDLNRFSAQVEKDANGLEGQICRPDVRERKTGLFIFTNKLARMGKVRFCLPGEYQGRVEEVDFRVEMSAEEIQDFRYAEMPLSSPKAFAAMQDAVRTILMGKNIASSDFAYVLISKSHGGGDYVIAPKLSYRSDLLNDDSLVARYVEIASTVTIREARFVDLVLPDGKTRVGDLILNGTRFEDVQLSSINASFGDLKISDLKIGDLGLGDSPGSLLKDLKVGDLKIGDLKVGDLKVGDLKVGDLKIGDLKVGDLKVGDLKIGDLKVGDLKAGDLKVGDLKTGDLKNDLASEARPLETPGVTKTAMVELLQEFGMAMPLVFFESCDSDLGEDLTYDLLHSAQRFNGSSGVESVYFSDRKGLQYETVNYGTLPIGRFFSNSLREALDSKKPG